MLRKEEKCEEMKNASVRKKSTKVEAKKRGKVNVDDRVKVALLYVVHRFIYGHQDIIGVEETTWGLVEDFDEFNNYHWGDVAYNQTFEKTHKAYEFQMTGVDKPKRQRGIHPQGMAGVLVWAVRVFPKLFEKCGKEININGWLPYILTVFCTNALTHVNVGSVLEPEDSVVQIREDIIWPEPRFDRMLIPGVIEGPLCDKVVMEEVSPIVQQPHVSQGSVHMKDAVKEGNVTEEQASDAAFNTWSDGDMEVDGLEEQARDAAVNPRSDGDIRKDRMDQLFSLVFRAPYMGNCNGEGMSDGASWNPINTVKEVGKESGGDLYGKPILDVGKEAVGNDEAETRRYNILGDDDAYAHDDVELLSTTLLYNNPNKKREEADNNSKSPEGEKRNHDEAVASGCADENALPKVGRVRKLSKALQPPFTTGKNSKKARVVPGKKVTFAEDGGDQKKKGRKKDKCTRSAEKAGTRIEIGDSPLIEGDENYTLKQKLLAEIKTPEILKVKIDYFKNFRLDSGVTEKDVQDVNDYINKGVDYKEDDPFATCNQFKTLLDKKGWLGDEHINSMLLLMRPVTLCADGKCTTIDARFQPCLTLDDEFKSANRYPSGHRPEGGKPWADTISVLWKLK
ncbi:hypothetical protein MKW92_032485 [Papaver armeniacum]|nr:hypothetical protein MKW92_032485 [Papaver armeniacum]